MIKRALMAAAAVFAVAACNFGQNQTMDNTVGGANVVSTAQAPMASATTSLSLDWGTKAQAGQIALADVLSYGGPKPTITAPTGWQLIRDDSTQTTRQSLYWHAVQAKDPSTATWTFSEPVDAQGALLLLDNTAPGVPVDITSGNTGSGGTATANSIVTTANGDLILAFYATDFGGPGLSPTMPTNVESILDQEMKSHEYWILANYQNQIGSTENAASTVSQLFNWVAAQIAIKRAAAPSGS